MVFLADLYQVEQIIIDSFQLEIRCIQSEQTLSVPQKPMDVLSYLMAHHPQLVTREELIEQVWDGNIYVGDKALTNAIWQLRSLFEQFGMTDFIQTVRKRGYRLTLTPKLLKDTTKPTEPVEQNAKTATLKSQNKQSRWVLFALWGIGLGVFAFLYGLAHFQFQEKPTGQPLYTAEEVPTLGTGRAQHPVVSPDQNWLAYTWRSFNGEANIYLQSIEQPDMKHQLTYSEQLDSHPAWDADGQHIAFLRRDPKHGQCTLMRVNRYTKEEQALTACRHSSSNYLASHPQRSEFFYNSTTTQGSNLHRLYFAADGSPITEALGCAGESFCQYPVRDFAVSPDGRYLALTRRAHRFSEDLFLLDLHTKKEIRLTHEEVDIIGLDWHPNSDAVLIGSIKGGQRTAYLIDIYEGNKFKLPFEDFSHPSQISQNGSVYYQTVETTMQLSYLSLDSEHPSSFFPITRSEFQHRNPHLNPITGDFAFISNRSGHDEIWLADPSFNNLRQLTHLNSVARYPRWSHAGTKIAFVARFPLEKHDVLSLLETDTGRIQRLYEFERVLGRPTWWHDDSKLIVRESGNLYLFDLTTNEMTAFTENGGIYAQSQPDGRTYFTKGSNQGLWLMENGQEHLLIPGDIFGTRYSWVVVDQGVYFYHLSDQSADLLAFYDFSTQEVRNMLTIPPELVSTQSTFAYDANKKRLIIESWQARSRLMKGQHPVLAIH